MTGKPGMLQFMVLQGVRHDLVTIQQKQGQWNAQKPCIGPKECHGVENQCFLVKSSNIIMHFLRITERSMGPMNL